MKKMKKLSYAMAVAVILGTSCNKLDEYNPANTSGEALWTTPDGFMTLVNGAYKDIHNMYGTEPGLLMGESGTDLWFNQSKASYANQLTRHEGMTPSQNTIKEGWTNLWSGVNQCNQGIAYIDKAGFKDPVEKAKRLSELKFMRALYYFHIVEQYGGVMLRTEPTTEVLLTATRSKPEEFYDLMISDLLYAKDNLPTDWGSSASSSEYGRASKKSAMGLLARVYLTRAYYSTGADAAAWFTKAKDAALDVINNKTALGCDLYTTPADLWKASNNELNKECLFAVTYSLTSVTYSYNTTNGNRMYKWFQTKYSDKPGLTLDVRYGYDNDQRLMPTWHLLDLFDETKDDRYDASFQETWNCNTKGYTWTSGNATTYYKDASVVGQNIDTATLAMHITKGVLANKSTTPYLTFDRNDTYTNPIPGQPAKIKDNKDSALKNKLFVTLKKFADPNRPAVNTAGGFNDVFAIRFAEMYMIAAEAFFQLGDNASAATNINVLRTRAMKPGATDFLISASDVTLNFILDERAREFCGEQLRYYDLKRVFRSDDFVDYIKYNNPDITAVTVYSRLRPIPQTEMDALLNSAEFGQNPGYQ